MFNQVIGNWYNAIEVTFQMQRDLLQKWTRLWLAVAASPAAFGEPPKDQKKRIATGANGASRVAGFTRAELAELHEALAEYEMTEGDWSKSR